jgi:isoamylase
VLRLVIDSLRYWVREMHVDGFRFDLATVLGMKNGVFDPDAGFFRELQQEPALQGIKLIAEPWDVKTRQTGKFPAGWMEWNDSYRDSVRRFLRGDAGLIGDFARVMTGSQDLFGGESVCASVNFVTAHDGFTLRDLYTYECKRNEENGEGNRDGTDYDFGFNCGAEGETGDREVSGLRRRMVRNGLCALFLSRGIPMLLSGDEVFRTQRGNNNAYCQDSEMSWFPWDQVEDNRDILSSCTGLIALRKSFPVLRQCTFFTGDVSGEGADPDLRWYGADLGRPDWRDGRARLLCCELTVDEPVEAAEGLVHRLFMIFNMGEGEAAVRLPLREGLSWYRIYDTGFAEGPPLSGKELLARDGLSVQGHTSVLLAGITPSV